MARIRVVTDSASDLPESFATSLDVDVVSLTIRFGDEEFTDRTNLTPEDFWAKCKLSKTLPETAAPSPGAFQAAYERAKSDGFDGVVVLTLSSLLSATYQSASLAAEAVEGTIEVKVIDTLNVSMGEGLLVIEAAELAQSGASIEEIVAHVDQLIKRSGVVATIDTLDHLIKGGRIGGAKALLGQVLSIKPLIELKDGVVGEAGRQRTRAKALAAVANVAASHAPLRRLALINGGASDVATLEALVRDIKTEYPIIVTDIGPVVGTHGGPGIIGLTWIEA
ncbi:MAG TPA: DegV family protein [Acidimicrobiales bacterium]|nr:DegV family protein [Acidimicrobiales bacterium]